jgi:D-alanyl-D-alanine carboxypeptidase
MLWLPLAGSANSALVPKPPAINADSYLLVDFGTGAVLVEHNPDL